jgi:hypothetical protein
MPIPNLDSGLMFISSVKMQLSFSGLKTRKRLQTVEKAD